MSKWVDEDELTITYRTLRQGMAEAQDAERERLIAKLESYFQLTQFSIEAEGASENLEWDAGFCAALALLKDGEK